MIAPEDIAEDVRRDGAAVWRNAAPPRLLTSLQSEAKRLVDGEHAMHFPKSTRVWDLYRHGQPFLDLLTLPHLTTALSALLGHNHLLSDYSLNVVNPRQPIDNWHLDYPYNEMPHLVTGSLLGLQCILTLTDFTPDNGATQYHPGSHVSPRKPPTTVDRPAVTFQAPAGSLLVMAGATWHRSGLNASTTPRAAILLSYVERWIRPMTDPPEPGLWSATQQLRLLLGQERPPETINGVPISSPTGAPS